MVCGCHHVRLRCKRVDILRRQGDGPHYREKISLTFGEFSQTHLHFTNQVKVIHKMYVYIIQKFGVRVEGEFFRCSAKNSKRVVFQLSRRVIICQIFSYRLTVDKLLLKYLFKR